MLSRIKNYFIAKRTLKALKSDYGDLHNIIQAYAWLKQYKALKDDTELFSRVSYHIPDGFIKSNYKNFATLMDAVNEACLFYQFGKRINTKVNDIVEYSYAQFMVNNYNFTISEEQVVDYIRTYVNYFIDDLFKYSIDEKSTIVINTRLVIINVAVLLKATLVLK